MENQLSQQGKIFLEYCCPNQIKGVKSVNFEKNIHI